MVTHESIEQVLCMGRDKGMRQQNGKNAYYTKKKTKTSSPMKHFYPQTGNLLKPFNLMTQFQRNTRHRVTYSIHRREIQRIHQSGKSRMQEIIRPTTQSHQQIKNLKEKRLASKQVRRETNRPNAVCGPFGADFSTATKKPIYEAG